MKQQHTKKIKRVGIKTISRQQQIRDEVYGILHKEVHNWFSFIDSREQTLQKRLNAIEANGIPDGILEELKRDISELKHIMRQTQKAMEELLRFFNVTKDFFNPSEEDKKATDWEKI